MTTFKSSVSGHSLYIEKISAKQFAFELGADTATNYTHFYQIKNWDAEGVVFLYMAKGFHNEYENSKAAAREYHVWYRNTKDMWGSYDTTMKKAIEGAQKNGWMYA